MTSASNAAGTYTFTYNAAGNVSSVVDPFGVTLSMGYDGAGNRTSVSDSDGGSVTSTFDAANELSGRTLSGGGATASVSISHDDSGQETTLTRSGAGATNTLYDNAGDITSIVTSDGGTTLFAQTYGYNAAGQLTSKVTGGTTETLSYDPSGQLTSAGGTTYSYDSNGVPNSGGLTPGSDNQVSSDGTWNYTYDLAGELTQKSLIAGGTVWNYSYDFDGNMTSAVETVSGSVTQSLSYTYDVFGNLVGRDYTVGGGTTSSERFVVDGWDTAKPDPTSNENFDDYAALGSNGSGGWTIARWTMFGAGFDQPVASISAAGSVSWYAADYQGSVQVVFGNSGSILASASYDSYGNVVSGSVTGFSYAFQGGMEDSATGLVHFGSRWFDPATQQWTSRDPLGLTPGPNASEFVGNGPSDGSDPSGRAIFADSENNALAMIDAIAAATAGPPGHQVKLARPRQLPSGIWVIGPVEDSSVAGAAVQFHLKNNAENNPNPTSRGYYDTVLKALTPSGLSIFADAQQGIIFSDPRAPHRAPPEDYSDEIGKALAKIQTQIERQWAKNPPRPELPIDKWGRSDYTIGTWLGRRFEDVLYGAAYSADRVIIEPTKMAADLGRSATWYLDQELFGTQIIFEPGELPSWNSKIANNNPGAGASKEDLDAYVLHSFTTGAGEPALILLSGKAGEKVFKYVGPKVSQLIGKRAPAPTVIVETVDSTAQKPVSKVVANEAPPVTPTREPITVRPTPDAPKTGPVEPGPATGPVTAPNNRLLSGQLEGRAKEIADPKLIASLEKKGYKFFDDAETQRLLDYFKANASTDLAKNISLRPNARHIEVLEEYLHNVMNNKGMYKGLSTAEQEILTKEWMIRHKKLLNITEEDAAWLQQSANMYKK